VPKHFQHLLANILIDYLQFYVPLKNFSLSIAGEGLQNSGLCSAQSL
jgi:hypothetical protein